jgi:hypothetical protein
MEALCILKLAAVDFNTREGAGASGGSYNLFKFQFQNAYVQIAPYYKVIPDVSSEFIDVVILLGLCCV